MNTQCLPRFGLKSFVFQFAIQKYRDEDIQDYNFACCFVWMSHFVFHVEEGISAEGVRTWKIFGPKRDEVTGN
jgi:hypothetical protein